MRLPLARSDLDPTQAQVFLTVGSDSGPGYSVTCVIHFFSRVGSSSTRIRNPGSILCEKIKQNPMTFELNSEMTFSNLTVVVVKIRTFIIAHRLTVRDKTVHKTARGA